jgi:hypothetical protein
MSSVPRTAARPDQSFTPEQARDARARAWAYVFDCHAKKNATGVTSTGGDNTKEGSENDFRANNIIQQ